MRTIITILKVPDLRSKVLFVIGILAIFRILAVIPVPGIDATRIKQFFNQSQLFGLLSAFSGGALHNFSIAMLGVGPYITATIIMQLLTMVFPSIKALYYEEGEAGRAKFNQYSRLLTLPLALIQAYSFITILQRQNVMEKLSPIDLAATLSLVSAGTLLLMWLGELITEKHIGNGVSLLIFSGIVSGVPNSIQQVIVTYDPSKIPTYIAFLIVAAIVIFGVVIINEAERKIPINYAKRVRGTKIYGGVTTYLPLRINQAGVIPIIFALSFLLFPELIGRVLAVSTNPVISKIGLSLQSIFSDKWLYASIYFGLVVIFTFFYTIVTFEPNEIATNLQKQGGFIPGIRPGKNTSDFLSFVLNRITMVGAIFLGIIAILPIVIQNFTGIKTLSLGGTSLLIVVSVALETMRQIEAQLIMREYEGF
jgi:preprotein translocase subunit SecY